MASNSDSSGKGIPKPGAEAAKKPAAVIDLKANEVELKDPLKDAGRDAAKAASTVASAAAKAAEGVADKPAIKPASVAATTAANASGRPAANADGGGNAGGNASSLPPKSGSSGGLRGAATHLVAGLAGGLLALLGAEAFLPQTVQPAGQSGAAMTPALDARLRTIESAAARGVPPELVQRLAAAEERLAQAENAARQTAQAQAQLAGETKSIGERLVQTPQGGPGEERVAKLEEILSTLSQAAANDPQRGRIPQLAAISGKLADLEASLATQIAQLRKGVTAEVDSRLGQSSEAAQAARAGTQRLDRELAGVKTEAAQIAGRLDGLKAQSDKLEIGLRGLADQAAALKADVARELALAAKSAEVSTALSPLTAKLAAIEQNVQGVVRGEDDRRQNVERIVTALELGNLKRTIDRGVAFGAELGEVRRVAGPKVDLSVLERYKDRGVPAVGELERDFRALAFRIIDADKQPANAHWTDRLIASAKSVVRVRKVDQGEAEDTSGAEAVVARMERGLKGGRFAEVVTEAGKLSEQARAPARPWLDKIEARAAVDRAIAAVEQELKASLGGASQAGKKG